MPNSKFFFLLVVLVSFLTPKVIAQEIVRIHELSSIENQRIEKLKAATNIPEQVFSWKVQGQDWLQEHFSITDHKGRVLEFQADKIVRRKNGIHSWIGKNITQNRFSLFVLNDSLNTINGELFLSDGQYTLQATGKVL